ncbi:MAG: PorP/SprF family type IX secretion system membrane protein [Paludibacter sp.]|nr:PorP/SprF family type IX secretion system membrane protein [Paludibacter sp.]
MKKFISIYILLLICVYFDVQSQSHIRVNNYWDNVYSMNPASINNAYFGTLTTAVRKQWINFPGSPTLMFATGTLYLENYYTQLGMKILMEKKGYELTADIDLSYAYEVMLRNDWFLNLGLSMSFQNHSYDISQIRFEGSIIPSVYDRLLFENNLNTDAGFELNYHSWKFGGISHNLLSLFNDQNNLHINTNILYCFYRQQNSDYLNLGIGLSAFQYTNIYQAEINLTGFFKKTTETNPFQIGVFYRTWREMGMIFGIEMDDYKIYYSCDYNFGQFYRHSFGSHEIMLIYNFSRSYKCRNCWWY